MNSNRRSEYMSNYYMVRAMFSREDDFQEFLKKDVVAVGWSSVDFSKYSSKLN